MWTHRSTERMSAVVLSIWDEILVGELGFDFWTELIYVVFEYCSFDYSPAVRGKLCWVTIFLPRYCQAHVIWMIVFHAVPPRGVCLTETSTVVLYTSTLILHSADADRQYFCTTALKYSQNQTNWLTTVKQTLTQTGEPELKRTQHHFSATNLNKSTGIVNSTLYACWQIVIQTSIAMAQTSKTLCNLWL